MAKNKKRLSPQTDTFPYSKIILSAILLFTFIIFSGTLKNNFIINWDDDVYVTGNSLIKDFSLNGIKNIFTTPYEGNYHPLTALLNAVEYQLFGLDSTAFHAVSLFLHLLNIGLVYFLILLVAGRVEVAAVVAVLFAIHPMHVESVAWVAEQKDVLYSFFYLLSLIYYLKYIKKKTISGSSPARCYLLSIVFFICSLLSKPMAVTLPVVLVLVDYYLNRLQLNNFKTVIKYIPFFCLSIIFGIVAIYSQSYTKAMDVGDIFSQVDRIFLASYATLLYLFKLVIPVELSAYYSFPEKINGLLPMKYYAAPVLILIIGFGIYKLKIFRSEFIFGFLFFFVTISIVLQLIPVGGAVVAERYTYIPYVGLFFIAGKIYAEKKTNILLARWILTVYVIIFSVLTFNRNKLWHDAYTLFNDTVKKDKSYIVYFNSGFAKEIIKHDYEGALQDYEMSFKLKKDFHLGYNNYGIVKGILHDYQASVTYFTKAVEAKQDYAEGYCNRGIAKNYLKDYEGAISDFSEAIRLKPFYGKAYSHRAEAYYYLNKLQEAFDDLHKGASLGDETAKEMLRSLNG